MPVVPGAVANLHSVMVNIDTTVNLYVLAYQGVLALGKCFRRKNSRLLRGKARRRDQKGDAYRDNFGHEP